MTLKISQAGRMHVISSQLNTIMNFNNVTHIRDWIGRGVCGCVHGGVGQFVCLRTRKEWEKRSSARAQRWRSVNAEKHEARVRQLGRRVKSHLQIAGTTHKQAKMSFSLYLFYCNDFYSK